MGVRSPNFNSSQDGSSLPCTNTHLAMLILDADGDSTMHSANRALLFTPPSSHLGDPKSGPLLLETSEKEDMFNPKQETGVRARAWNTTLVQPLTWMIMLCRELDATFVFGVMVVYGVSQGLGVAIDRVVVDYYWKDVQAEQPSTVQFYRGLTWIPWDVKPIYGLLTDMLPVVGYHRRPYFLFSGIVTVLTTLVLVLGGKLHVASALTMFVGRSAASAMADVTIDALVATKSRQKPFLASHIQSLCATCASLGSLIGFLLSGLAVHTLGSQGALGVMLVPGVLLLLLGFVIYEPRLPRHLWHSDKVGQQMWQVSANMWATLKHAEVWQPTLYMYLSWALSPDISEGKFYWYNDTSVGPAFSEEFVGVIFAIGSVGTLLGVFLYQKFLRTWSFRRLLCWSQLLLAGSGMLDFVLVTRLNLKLHVPDYMFVVVDEAVSQAMVRMKWMPLLVLAAKLCPPGIEGTFFALLMSVDNMGWLSASWGGGVLLKVVGVSRTNFQFLWLAVLVRNLMRLLPLLFLFLVPSSDPERPLLPPELDGLHSDDSQESLGPDSEAQGAEVETLHLVVLHPPKNTDDTSYT